MFMRRRHFRFYSFHLQGSSAQLTLVTDFTIPTHTRVFGWSIFDNTVGCIYENPVGELYFCTANLALFVSTLTVKFGQVGFDLFKITDEVCGPPRALFSKLSDALYSLPFNTATNSSCCLPSASWPSVFIPFSSMISRIALRNML